VITPTLAAAGAVILGGVFLAGWSEAAGTRIVRASGPA
jgi:hypothetical protein